MNIDERLNAISESLELGVRLGLDSERKLAILTDQVTKLSNQVDKVTIVVEKLAETVGLLTKIVQNHQQKLDSLEGAN